MSAPLMDANAVRSDVRSAVRFVVALSALGIALHALVGRAGVADPLPNVNVFFRLYWLNERPHIVVLLAFSLGLWRWAEKASSEHAPDASEQAATVRDALWMVGIAAFVLVVAGSGWILVMHRTPLSMDEFNASFQGRLFATGRLSALLPDPWGQLWPSVTPINVSVDQEARSWTSAYWPVHGAIRALFVLAGVEGLASPLMAAACIPLVGSIQRRIAPDMKDGPLLASLALATSAQFLVQAMTVYAMTSHILFNLLWLRLMLGATRMERGLAPVLGGVALGLHNPFPHALFVAPFLLRMLRERSWGTLAWQLMIYTVFSLVWFAWMRAHREPGTGAGMAEIFAIPGIWMMIVQSMNLVEVATWLSPWACVAVAVALAGWRHLQVIERDLALGIALSFGFYFFFASTQGHGWGYRYIAPVSGSMAILAASGIRVASVAWSRRLLFRGVIVTSLVTLAVLVPFRGWQVKRFVRPFAHGFALVKATSARIVIVEVDSLWYGQDLLRNEPDLRAPIVVRGSRLRPEHRLELERRFSMDILYLSSADFAKAGWPRK